MAENRKKQRRSVPTGQLHVQATFNNTIISFLIRRVMLLLRVVLARQASAEVKRVLHMQPRSLQKRQQKTAKGFGLKSVDVFVKGVGQGRDAVRALTTADISIDSIKEVTGVPGGVRPRKQRRG